MTDHRIYCGFPGRTGTPGLRADRIAAVRRLLAVGCHVTEQVPQAAVAFDRLPLANKVVGFRVRERVA